MARLDVAMFNAILRESADEIPTDPVSDPISNLKVLPIPAGKYSFGAGAQLKNTVRITTIPYARPFYHCTVRPLMRSASVLLNWRTDVSVFCGYRLVTGQDG